MSSNPEVSKQSLFEEVALIHLDSLHNLALQLTRNPHEAEDLTQEAFLRAYRFFDRFEQGTNCRAWLFRILRNCFINRYRNRRARPEDVDFGAIEGKLENLMEPGPGAVLNPEVALGSARIDEAVQIALREIPEDYRAALVLSLVEGFSYREVASILSCPIGTVMSRIHRARKLLREQLVDLARSEGILIAAEDEITDDSASSAEAPTPVDIDQYKKRSTKNFKDG